MRRSASLVMLAVLLGVAAYVTPWSLLFPRPAPAPVRSVRELRTSWKTEGGWLAGEVLRDLAEMTAFARDAPRYRQAPPQVSVSAAPASGEAPVLRFALAFGDLRVERPFTPQRFIWSPDDYAPVATELLAGARLTASAPSSDDDLLARLLDLRAETLVDVDASVSARLQASLLDAGAHEDAALLLSAFAWREAAGTLSDTRRLLGRAAAHLALARALRAGGEPSLHARVAEAAFLTLAGRAADAARALAAFDGQPGAAEAWARAIRLRLDDDWRRPVGPSLLEQLALYRARAYALTLGHAMQGLDEAGRTRDVELPDWGRIALTADQTVEAGARFALDGVTRELDELRRVRARLGVAALDETTLVRATNVPAARCIVADGPRVLGWRAWAEAFQRHAAFFVVVADVHQREMLTLPEEADGLAAELHARLADMRLLPIGETRRAMLAAQRPPRHPLVLDPATLERALSLATEQPELIASLPWESLEAAAAVRGRAAPAGRAWFAPVLPFGTTYAIQPRFLAMPHTPAWLAHLFEISPGDYFVTWFRLGIETARSQSAAGIADNFGPRAEYDRRVVWRMAATGGLGRDSADVRLRTLQRLCALDADACGGLGEELVDRGDDDAAAVAYQRGVDAGLDRVVVSHNCAFLVRHYELHGQPARAMSVAAMAGRVGSWSGLATLGRQLERRGRLAEAEATFTALRERYSQSDWPSDVALLGFYYRVDRVRHERAYRGRFAAAAQAYFPAGLERFDAARRDAAPERSVTVLRASERMLRFGLHSRDLIVAVDGWRVGDLGQLKAVLAFDDAPETAVTVWRDGAYHDLKLRLADRVIDAWFPTADAE